jgi:hypothetical protein
MGSPKLPVPAASREECSRLGGTRFGLGRRAQFPSGSAMNSMPPITHLLGQMFFLRLHPYWTGIAIKLRQNG